MIISDINAEARLLTNTDTTSYTAANLLRRINAAYEIVIGWIINADGTWQFDDSNYTDQPRGTLDLVEGQQAYTFNSDYLQIEMIELKDTSGNWRRITPLDHSDLGGVSPDEYYGMTSGSPNIGMQEHYDLFTDDSFRLYPAPTSGSVTLTAGLRVTFKRTADLFTSAQVTTGTKTPGFASPYHIILSYMAAIPYCMAYKKDRVALYEKKVAELKDEIIKHYANRQKDWHPRLQVKRRPYR